MLSRLYGISGITFKAQDTAFGGVSGLGWGLSLCGGISSHHSEIESS